MVSVASILLAITNKVTSVACGHFPLQIIAWRWQCILYIHPLASLGKSCQGSPNKRLVKGGKLLGSSHKHGLLLFPHSPLHQLSLSKVLKVFFFIQGTWRRFLIHSQEWESRENFVSMKCSKRQLIISSPRMSICYEPWTQTRTLCSCPSSAPISLCVLGNDRKSLF